MRDNYRESLESVVHDLVEMTGLVQVAVRDATTALLEADLATAEKTISADACFGVDLGAAFPGVCAGAADFTELDACVTARAKCHICRYVNAADAVAADCDAADDMLVNGSCAGG